MKYKFDKAKYYMGRICKNNHEHGNTGKSLRYKNSNNCIVCHRDRCRLRYVKKPREEIPQNPQLSLKIPKVKIVLNLTNYFVPVIDVMFTEYVTNRCDIQGYIEREAKRIKNKGCNLILIQCQDTKKNGGKKVFLIREYQKNEYFKLSSGYHTVQNQYEGIAKIIKAESTVVLKVY